MIILQELVRTTHEPKAKHSEEKLRLVGIVATITELEDEDLGHCFSVSVSMADFKKAIDALKPKYKTNQ